MLRKAGRISMNLGSNLEEVILNGVKLRFEPHFA